jgi:16S rRNA (uracil1498-N3)-methyltransferase
MKIHRFIGDYDLSKEEVEIVDPKIIKQIKTVLRLKKGEKIVLSNGKGQEVEISLDLISSDKVTGIVTETKRLDDAKSHGQARKVNLYLAILKKENFELAVQKSVEAGVYRIIPIITQRTIKTGLNFPRLEKIIIEASEQSGRSVVSTLSPILNFKEALIDGANSQEKLIFHPTGITYTPSTSSGRSDSEKSSDSMRLSENKNTENISIFIGPEGGFTEKEIEEAKRAGYTVTSLGSLTLRAETAAIIATYRTVKGI